MKPKIGQTIIQPPILKGGKTQTWLITHVNDPIPFEEPWPLEFKKFFSNVGLPGLYDMPIYDSKIGTMRNNETGLEEDLTDIFWKLFGV